MRLILASGSPRRLELLAQIGVVPEEIRPPDIDETERPGEKPRDYCRRITAEKASATQVAGDEVALCADTTVALGRRILGKPANVEDARDYLNLLSGRRHRVITAIAVKRGDQLWTRDVVTTVKLKVLSEAEREGYLKTGDWQGKAGAYGIQGPAGAFVTWLQGSYTAVVGLPVAETSGLLQAAGYPIWT